MEFPDTAWTAEVAGLLAVDVEREAAGVSDCEVHGLLGREAAAGSRPEFDFHDFFSVGLDRDPGRIVYLKLYADTVVRVSSDSDFLV